MSDIVTTTQPDSLLAKYSNEQMEVISSHIAKGATPTELQYFLAVSKRLGLDPFGRQVYFIKRKDKTGKEVGTVQISIDGFRAIAARTGLHAGTDDVVFDSEDGEHPNKATVTVYRFVKGVRVAFPATARWSEYVQETDEWIDNKRTGKKVASFMWKKMPFLMLGKVAEALALRRAFPEFLSGVYSHDEMAQADETPRDLDANPNPSTVVVDSIDPSKNKATAGTMFILGMLIDESEPTTEDLESLKGWLQRNFKVGSIDELNEEQALKLIEVLEKRKADKIAEDKPEEPKGPEVPPASPSSGEVAKQADPAPEKRERTYKEWLDMAMQIKDVQTGANLISDMSQAGVPDYQIKAINAILDGRLKV